MCACKVTVTQLCIDNIISKCSGILLVSPWHRFMWMMAGVSREAQQKLVQGIKESRHGISFVEKHSRNLYKESRNQGSGTLSVHVVCREALAYVRLGVDVGCIEALACVNLM